MPLDGSSSDLFHPGTRVDFSRKIVGNPIAEPTTQSPVAPDLSVKFNGTPKESHPVAGEGKVQSIQSNGVEQKISPAGAKQEAIDRPKNNEHVLYAPQVRIIPDTHGLDPAHYGVDKDARDVVAMGDLIDAPKNLHRRNADKKTVERDLNFYPSFKKLNSTEQQSVINREAQRRELTNKAADAVNIKKSVETWNHLMETDQGKVVLGNHELMALSGIRGNDQDMANWLIENNKGSTTLEAFGIDLKKMGIPVPRLVPDPSDPSGEAKMLVDVPTKEQLALIRQKVKATPELSKFFDLIQQKGKMYAIANEALVVHAGIPVDKNGHLIPPQRRGRTWPGFEGVVGLDAMDKIEEGIRKGDKDILHYLANGSSKEMSPAWMREPFFAVMEDQDATFTALGELSSQAKKRGGDVKVITIGHSEAVGGTRVGKRVLGADTGIGDVITLDADSGKNVRINARHNFNVSSSLGYDLSNEIKGSDLPATVDAEKTRSDELPSEDETLLSIQVISDESKTKALDDEIFIDESGQINKRKKVKSIKVIR